MELVFDEATGGYVVASGQTMKTVKQSDPILAQAMPYIVSDEAWKNYCNEDLYEAELMLRSFIESQPSKWHNSRFDRRYTFAMLFRALYGIDYEQSKHAKMIKPLTRLFSHYSVRILNGGVCDHKTQSKTIYVLSRTRLKKPPYSLKMRLEWMAENGIVPSLRNMGVEPTLKPGHARNPKTEANMQKRAEQRRAQLNEYQRERKRRIADGTWEGRDSR